MNRGHLPHLATIALAAALATLGCASSQPEEVIIPPTTEVIDDATAAFIISVSEDKTVVFGGASERLASLDPGDVMIIGVSDATPNGFIGRIETVDRSGETVTVETGEARLQDAIEKGRIQSTMALTADDITEMTMLQDGVTFIESASLQAKGGDEFMQGDGLVFGFEDLVLYDDEGGEVILNGNLAVNPRFELTIDIDGYSLDELSFVFASAEGVSFQLDSTTAATLSESVPLLNVVFAVIVVTVGPVPVVITPTLSVSLGADGEVTAGLSASVTQTASLEIGVGLIEGELRGISDSSSSFDFDIPSPDATAGGRVFAGPRLSLLIYGLVGPFAEANGFLELSAFFEGSPPCLSWALTAGLVADVGMKFIADFEATVIDEGGVLTSFDCLGDDPEPMGADNWANTYGGDGGDRAIAVQQTPDGGYIFTALTLSFVSSTAVTWVVKTDRNGVIEWQRAYDGINLPTSVQLVPTGGYLLASGVAGTNPEFARATRLDENGGVIWAKSYMGADIEESELVPHGVRVLSDGSFVLAGTAGRGSTNAWVGRFDASGNAIWSKTFGGDGFDAANAVDLVSDGGFIVAGTTNLSFGDAGESLDLWAFKLDSGGAVQWEKRFGGDGDVPGQNDALDQGFDVVHTRDGGYAVAGLSGSFGNSDAWIVKLDSGGNVVWTTNFDGGATIDRPNSIIETADDGLVVAGRGGLLTRDSAAWLFKLAPDGVVAWSKTYDGRAGDAAGHLSGAYNGIGDVVSATTDGGLIVAGTTRSFGESEDDDDEDVWLLKLTRTGEVEFAPGGNAAIGNNTGAFFAPENVKALTTSASVVDLPLALGNTTNDLETVETAATVRPQ